METLTGKTPHVALVDGSTIPYSLFFFVGPICDRTQSAVEQCIESIFGARFVARSALCCCPQSHANDVWFELLLSQEHSSFVAVSAKTTWHPCVSHSSLVCGDSSPTRLLTPVFWNNVWLILSVVVANPCLSFPSLRRT